MDNKPILISGIPRSGSTWLAKVLSNSPDSLYIHEPDNEKHYLKAFFLKEKLHRYPYLKKSQRSDLYYRLWESILTEDFNNIANSSKVFQTMQSVNPFFIEREIGKKCNLILDEFFSHTDVASRKKVMNVFAQPNVNNVKRKKTLIVKSVHNLLALDWISNNFDCKIIVIVRHPANVASSYLKLRMPDSIRNLYSQKILVEDYLAPFLGHIKEAQGILAHISLQIGAFYYVLEQQLKKNDQWILIKHEDLCYSPESQFKILFDKLDLEWNENVQRYIRQSNKQGEGFDTKRVAKKQINKYKNLLSDDMIEEIKNYYSVFNNSLYKKFYSI
ncbi:MAG: sulfotransferase [Firmicutes bacterium]|nr:sulfotransferase [Bacillota bacterium]